MSAANSLETKSKPVADQRLPEPSMEEILASIRRIIADDESLPGRKAVATLAPEPGMSSPSDPRAEGADAHGDPLQPVAPTEQALSAGGHVSEDVLENEGPAHHADVSTSRRSAFMTGYEASHAIAEPDDLAPYAARSAMHENHADGPVTMEHELRGPHASHKEQTPPSMDAPVEQDTHGLSPDALFSDATHQSVAAAFRTLAATRLTANSEELLDIARDMIRPLLKSWIDNNVPTMVERMVRAEIERVARGGR